MHRHGHPSHQSPPITLKTGAAQFTFNPFTKIPFPTGNYTIIRADFEIISDKGSGVFLPVPLTEVYNHQ